MNNPESSNKDLDSRTINSFKEGKNDQHIDSDKVKGGRNSSTLREGESGKTSAG